MNIVLVFPPFSLPGMYSLPPLGLIQLGTILINNGHRVQILDQALDLARGRLIKGRDIYEEAAQEILDLDPDVVGFSVQCTTLPPCLQIASRLKDKGRPLVVFGGHTVAHVDVPLMEAFGQIDFIVRGEGEKSLPSLINALDSGSSLKEIRGLSYRYMGDVIQNPDEELISNLDELPFPDYSLSPPISEYQMAYGMERPIYIVEVGRGCPHRCVYCSESLFWKRRVRRYSVSRVLACIKELYERYKVRCLLLAHDQFTEQREYVESLCKGLLEMDLREISWYCISRLDTVDQSLLRLMAEAGCESMCYGIDSGSENTLAFIRKSINKGLLFQRVKETTSLGMIPTLSFVIGFPEESRKDIDETLGLALRCGALGNINPLIQLPTVLPGTELYNRYKHTLVREVDTYFALGLEFFEGKRIPEDEVLIDSRPDLFSCFYNIPCKGLGLKELDTIAKYFSIIVTDFPKTFLALSMIKESSITLLTLHFIDYISERKKANRSFITRKDIFTYMKSFISKQVLQRFPWLRDVMLYELTGYIASLRGYVLENNEKWEPVSTDVVIKNKGLLVQRFKYDLSSIFSDLNDGLLRSDYISCETYMAFRHQNRELSVYEINEFGYDLIKNSNGQLDLKAISDILSHKYAKGKNEKGFLEAVLQAASELHRIGFIRGVPKLRKEEVD